MADVLNTPLNELTPLSADVLACPHQFNARLRAEAPVHKCPHTGIVFVSDYATVTRIAKDHQTFSNRFALAMGAGGEVDPRLSAVREKGYPPVDTMLTQDPPLHRRYRGMVNQAFTLRRVNTLEPYIHKVCNDLIDQFIDKGEVEIVEAFCERVPMIVIADQLGVPLSDYELFKTWSDAFVAQLSGMADPEEALAAAEMIVEFQHYFAARLEERRADRRDDIISDMVHARFEDERPLDIPEMLSIIQQLLVAGNETTTHTLSEGILLMIQNPDQFKKLKADRALVPNLVEEVLRLTSPTANMWRVVTKDTDINGVAVTKGGMVQIRFASANRDEQKFARSETFDVERDNARSNIAFGHGVHMCIGAALARKELDVAFRVILDRFESLSLNGEPEDLVYPPNVLLRGLQTLPVRFVKQT